MDRRTVLKGAAWAVPVIAAAVAIPAATASVTRLPIGCEKLPNHGHGGNVANQWWNVTYNDGTSELLDNGTVMSDKNLKAICKK